MKIEYITENNIEILFDAPVGMCVKCDIKDGFLYFCKKCDFTDKSRKRLGEIYRRMRDKLGIKQDRVGRPKLTKNFIN